MGPVALNQGRASQFRSTLTGEYTWGCTSIQSTIQKWDQRDAAWQRVITKYQPGRVSSHHSSVSPEPCSPISTYFHIYKSRLSLLLIFSFRLSYIHSKSTYHIWCPKRMLHIWLNQTCGTRARHYHIPPHNHSSAQQQQHKKSERQTYKVSTRLCFFICFRI